MLQRLEAPDRDAKLLARFQVLECHGMKCFHGANRLGAQRSHCPVDSRFD